MSMRKLKHEKKKPNCNLCENNPALKKTTMSNIRKKTMAMPWGMAVLFSIDYQSITSLA
jgi:hypothetical protein